MPHKESSRSTGSKTKHRPRSTRRRKASPKRKLSLQTKHDGKIQEYVQRETQKDKENVGQERPKALDAAAIVSPNTYRQYARTALLSHQDKIRHLGVPEQMKQESSKSESSIEKNNILSNGIEQVQENKTLESANGFPMPCESKDSIGSLLNDTEDPLDGAWARQNSPETETREADPEKQDPRTREEALLDLFVDDEATIGDDISRFSEDIDLEQDLCARSAINDGTVSEVPSSLKSSVLEIKDDASVRTEQMSMSEFSVSRDGSQPETDSTPGAHDIDGNLGPRPPSQLTVVITTALGDVVSNKTEENTHEDLWEKQAEPQQITERTSRTATHLEKPVPSKSVSRPTIPMATSHIDSVPIPTKSSRNNAPYHNVQPLQLVPELYQKSREIRIQTQTRALQEDKQNLLRQLKQQKWAVPSLKQQNLRDMFIINSLRTTLIQGNRDPVSHKAPTEPEVCPTGTYKAAPMATNYDVDSEHAYIMSRALRSYKEHRAREGSHGQLGTVPEGRHGDPRLARRQGDTSVQGRPSEPSLQGRPSDLGTLRVQTDIRDPQIPDPSGHEPRPARPRAQSARLEARSTSNIDINIPPAKITHQPKRPMSSPGRPLANTHRTRHLSQSSVTSSQSLTSRSKVTHQLHIPTNHARLLQEVQSANSVDYDKSSRRLLPTSHVFLSMDRVAKHKTHDPGSRKGQSKGQGHGRQQVEGSFFTSTRPRKQHFSIHPEWVSESLSVQPLSINSRMHTSATFPAPERRCKSAPPSRQRNPITWENADMSDVRLRQRKRTSRERPKSANMDSIGNRDESKEPSGATSSKKGPKFKYEGTFFGSTNSPRKQYFTIHPEWMSESKSSRPKISYEQRTMTFPPRRCKSAPPPRSRNPITWENPDRPDWR